MDLTPFPGPPSTPPEVPGFRLLGLLGFGAHGEVWHAEDLITGDEVALKIGRRRVVAGAAPNENDRYGTDYETALLCRIEHPHIVRLRRVVALPDDALALVLDLAAGGSLASLVAARGVLAPEEVVTLVIPIVSALEHLHQSGITHGDVSPGNLLLTAEGCPQLGDLGVARVLGERHEDAWSTPGFTDPALLEALRHGGVLPEEVLRAADRWALAASCWFALTGQAPQALARPPDLPGNLPGDLHHLLARCLSPDPEDRPGLTEFADLAWQAAHPAPIRLGPPPGPRPGRLTGDAGAPGPESLTTRPVLTQRPDPAGDEAEGPPDDGETAAFPFGRPTRERPSRRRTVPMSRLLVLLVAVGLVGAVTAGVGWRLLREPGDVPATRASAGAGETEGGARTDGGGPGGGGSAETPKGTTKVDAAETGGQGKATEDEAAAPGEERSGDKGTAGKGTAGPKGGGTGGGKTKIRPGRQLNAELVEALSRIGRARAQAFEMVSQRQLVLADQLGSPAERADLGLLKRLRTSGYRLEALSYRIVKVTVLEVRGQRVEVSAVVSTSAHRQVRMGGDFSAGEAPARPARVVFTLAAVGDATEGAGRWRVYDIRGKA